MARTDAGRSRAPRPRARAAQSARAARPDDVGPAGLSAAEARARERAALARTDLADDELPAVPAGVATGELPIEALTAAADQLAVALGELGQAPSASPWRLAGLTDADRLDARRCAQTVKRLLSASAALEDPHVRALAARAYTPAHLDLMADWLASGATGSLITTGDAREVVGPTWHAHAEHVRAQVEAYRQEHVPHLGPFVPDVVTADLDAALAAAQQADARLLTRRRRRREALASVAVFVRPGVQVDLGSLTALVTDLVAARDALPGLVRTVGELPGVGVPDDWNALDDDAVAALDRALHAWESAAALEPAGEPDGAAELDAATLAVAVAAADGDLPAGPSAAAGALRTLADAWRALVDVLQVGAVDAVFWQAGRTLAETLAHDGPLWHADVSKAGGLVRLTRWVRVRAALAALDEQGLTEVAGLVRAGRLDAETVRDAVELAVVRAVLAERQAAGAATHDAPLDGAGAPVEEADEEPEDTPGALPGDLVIRSALASRYVPASDAPVLDLFVLDNVGISSNLAKVRAQIDEILTAEAPVTADRMAHLVARRFGLERLREARRATILQTVPKGRLHRSPNGDLVVWHVAQDPDTWTGYRVPAEGTRRELVDVPYEELRNALVDTARRAHGLPEARLVALTAAAFGVRRPSAAAAQRLADAITVAVREGVLTRREESLIAT
ncbi:hypothetical protein ACTHAM_001404 [Cellulomonas soli]|uniref:hypothetical protein n=1 Tax=Cellulomonas soli TaxID=931535 RepID=UPI003F83487C